MFVPFLIMFREGLEAALIVSLIASYLKRTQRTQWFPAMWAGVFIAAALCLALSAFFYYAWYAFYLKWDFNELGRYYDPVDQVVYTSSGFVWVLPATVLLAAGAVFIWRGWRR